ncbi:MAG: DUF5683 domain-containing protein [bacterium]
MKTILFLSCLTFYKLVGAQQTIMLAPQDYKSESQVNLQQYGHLKIFTNFDTIYIVVDGDFNQYRPLANGDSIKLAVGIRKITLVSRVTLDYEFDVDIKENVTIERRFSLGKVTNYLVYNAHSSYPKLYWRANLMIYTDDESDILIDGKSVGPGYVMLDLKAGTYKATTKHPLAGKTTTSITVRSNRLTIAEMYNKPKKTTARLLSVLPGWSQYYQKETMEGLMIGTATVVGLGLAYKFHQDYNKNNVDYLEFRDQYSKAQTEPEALRLGNKAETSFRAAEKAANIRDILLYSALGIYIYNLIDGWNAPKSGYLSAKESRKFIPQKVFRPFFSKNAVGVFLSVKF